MGCRRAWFDRVSRPDCSCSFILVLHYGPQILFRPGLARLSAPGRPARAAAAVGAPAPPCPPLCSPSSAPRPSSPPVRHRHRHRHPTATAIAAPLLSSSPETKQDAPATPLILRLKINQSAHTVPYVPKILWRPGGNRPVSPPLARPRPLRYTLRFFIHSIQSGPAILDFARYGAD